MKGKETKCQRKKGKASETSQAGSIRKAQPREQGPDLQALQDIIQGVLGKQATASSEPTPLINRNSNNKCDDSNYDYY